MSLAKLATLTRLNIKYSCSIWSLSCRLTSTQAPAPPSGSNVTQQPPPSEEDVKKKILEAALPFVNVHGWTKEALSAGAIQVGYPNVVQGMFRRGGAELIEHFQQESNQKLIVLLKKLQEDQQTFTLTPTQFVERAVKERLLMISPYKSRWPQAIAIMSLPPNVPKALASLLTLVDDICYYAGDRSVDFNWYMRRIALAGVYKATELYYVQDSSQDNYDTWKFLNRRLADAVQVHELLLQSEMAGKVAKETISAAFTTARNILGMNFSR